jgi:basic membrane protein A and related proteins
MEYSRRSVLRGLSAGSVAVGLAGLGAVSARAAGPIPIGVLIPGSKTDKGWMESGYDGMLAAEKKYKSKIKVSYIENVQFADMPQALVQLASANVMVIGVGGQTQASVFKVAPRFPSVKFAIVGGNDDPARPKNVSIYDVRQAEIAFVTGAAAAMLSKTGVVNYIGGLQIPAIVNAGTEFGLGAKYVNPKIETIITYTGDFDDVQKAKEAELAAIAKGADVSYNILNLGVRGQEEAAREKHIHMIGSYTDRCGSDPLYIAYSITGVGFIVEWAITQLVHGTWTGKYKPFGLVMGPHSSGFVVCQGETPAMRAKLKEIEHKLLTGQIKVLAS